jgi:hypothetical protein
MIVSAQLSMSHHENNLFLRLVSFAGPAMQMELMYLTGRQHHMRSRLTQCKTRRRCVARGWLHNRRYSTSLSVGLSHHKALARHDERLNSAQCSSCTAGRPPCQSGCRQAVRGWPTGRETGDSTWVRQCHATLRDVHLIVSRTSAAQ